MILFPVLQNDDAGDVQAPLTRHAVPYLPVCTDTSKLSHVSEEYQSDFLLNAPEKLGFEIPGLAPAAFPPGTRDLQPDLLAERYVVTELADSPPFAAACWPGLTAVQAAGR